MTAIVQKPTTWSGSSQADSDRPSERRRPLLRVIPTQNAPDPEPAQSPSRSLLSPRSFFSPTSPSSNAKSSSLKEKMHFRLRSISGKSGLTPAKKWERLSQSDKATSDKFTKNAISMCGLAGYSWRKTHEYLIIAADLPLHPDYYLNPEEAISTDPSPSASASSSRRPSTSHLLTPDAAASIAAAARPGSSTPSTLSATSSTTSIAPDLKPILTKIRLLFEEMQQKRDSIYMYYINLPKNNLKKMHAHAVAQHRAAVLRVERSSLMDAIEFDRMAERSRPMELAVAKLRFEMELDVEASLPDEHATLTGGVLKDVKEAEKNDRLAAAGGTSIHTSHSTSSFGSAKSLSGHNRSETSDMRREASINNRVSGVPTITTTVSDMTPLHMRHTSVVSGMSRPASPASAKSEGHVQTRETWVRLQQARQRLTRRSRSRVDGVSHPGQAQNLDGQGFFANRPA